MMLVGTSHIFVKDTHPRISNHAIGASARTVGTWIVVALIFVLLIAVFLIELNLRKVGRPSHSAIFAYQITWPALPTLVALCLHVEAGIPYSAAEEF